MHYLAQLNHLAQAGFTCNDCPYSALNWRLLVLQILNFLHNQWAVLLGCQAVDTVEEYSSVVIRNQVGLPSLQELLLETIDHVS